MTLVAGFALVLAAGADPAAELAPAPQCAGLEALLDARDLDEPTWRSALSRVRELALDRFHSGHHDCRASTSVIAAPTSSGFRA